MVFIILCAFGLLAVSQAADAPQRAKVPRVGGLRVDSPPQWGHNEFCNLAFGVKRNLKQ